MGGAWRGGLALAGRGLLAGSTIFRCFLYFTNVLCCPSPAAFSRAASTPKAGDTPQGAGAETTCGWGREQSWRQERRREEVEERGRSGRKWGEGAEVTGSVPREEEGRGGHLYRGVAR